jgi:sulfide:quinone oxidoreductase
VIRPRVLVVGAGVAGLECLLALRALLGDRIEVTVLAPEARFVNRSMAVAHPSRPAGRHGIPLRDVANDLGVRWHRDRLRSVDPAGRRVVTVNGTALTYDRLVLAMGASSEREWRPHEALTYHGRRDRPAYRLLLRRLQQGRVRRLAFVKPAGPSWPLPLYELALATAEELRGHDVELSLLTPEQEPLEVFGGSVSATIRGVLEAHGIVLRTGTVAAPSRPRRLHLSPDGGRLEVDAVVTLPSLAGPRPAGVPADAAGFIVTDPHGRVSGLEDAFAAGDATAFAIKQGGLAAQQADAVAEAIAASLGADIEPRPFRPVLRGLLLSGGRPLFLRADLSASKDESCISPEPLWWPPNRLCGSYLAPYLSSQVGFACDVRSPVGRAGPDQGQGFATLRDLPAVAAGDGRSLRELGVRG